MPLIRRSGGVERELLYLLGHRNNKPFLLLPTNYIRVCSQCWKRTNHLHSFSMSWNSDIMIYIWGYIRYSDIYMGIYRYRDMYGDISDIVICMGLYIYQIMHWPKWNAATESHILRVLDFPSTQTSIISFKWSTTIFLQEVTVARPSPPGTASLEPWLPSLLALLSVS